MKRSYLRWCLLTLVGLTPSFGYAQPAQPAPDKEFTLTVTNAEIAKIGEALGKLPYNEVAPMFFKLQQQVSKQNEQPKTPPVEEKK